MRLSDEHIGDSELQLICHLESVGHIADDIRLRPTFPYAEDSSPYTSDEFLKAVEDQQEPRALELLNGALADGLHFEDLELDLATAALRHYNDFGHTLIYLSKISSLIERLGTEVEKPLLQSYVRGLIYTTREDLIPEFRGYATALSHWQNGNSKSMSGSSTKSWTVGSTVRWKRRFQQVVSHQNDCLTRSSQLIRLTCCSTT